MADPLDPSRKWSEERKAKHREAMKGVVNAGQFKKGVVPWSVLNKGKYSTSQKGKKFSVEWRKKLSDAKKGRKMPWLHTPEMRKKAGEAQRGEKHHNWRGADRSIHDRIRNNFKYKEWRKGVYERDNYTCVQCGDKQGGNLQADHYPTALAIILRELEFSYGKEKVYEMALEYPKLWDITNGRTLCVECHYKTDTYGGKLSHALAKQKI